jgi:adenylosuccinate lyase
LLKADAEVAAHLPAAELEQLFDQQYYLRHIDQVFQHLRMEN